MSEVSDHLLDAFLDRRFPDKEKFHPDYREEWRRRLERAETGGFWGFDLLSKLTWLKIKEEMAVEKLR